MNALLPDRVRLYIYERFELFSRLVIENVAASLFLIVKGYPEVHTG